VQRNIPLALAKLKRGMKMKVFKQRKQRAQGKVGWILLWLLGVPLPILFILFLLRGCT
jgi:hypothetical protein